MNGFIKLDRKIAEWGWYTDIKTFKLFFHLLLFANYKDGEFRGIKIGRGQIARSVDTLSSETGLTPDEIRTGVKHLITTGDIICERHPKYTLFTVVNYESYQAPHQTDTQSVNSHFPNTSQASPEQIPNTSRQINKYNNYNKYNNKNNYNNTRTCDEKSDFDENELLKIALENTRRKIEKMYEEDQ